MARNYYKNDPRVITARFDSTCAETGQTIKKGDKCIYYPLTKKVFTMDSKQATEFYEYQHDLDMGYDY